MMATTGNGPGLRSGVKVYIELCLGDPGKCQDRCSILSLGDINETKYLDVVIAIYNSPAPKSLGTIVAIASPFIPKSKPDDLYVECISRLNEKGLPGRDCLELASPLQRGFRPLLEDSWCTSKLSQPELMFFNTERIRPTGSGYFQFGFSPEGQLVVSASAQAWDRLLLAPGGDNYYCAFKLWAYIYLAYRNATDKQLAEDFLNEVKAGYRQMLVELKTRWEVGDTGEATAFALCMLELCLLYDHSVYVTDRTGNIFDGTLQHVEHKVTDANRRIVISGYSEGPFKVDYEFKEFLHGKVTVKQKSVGIEESTL
jgi:hypothetical protein